jgi:hypothetical protein
MTGQPDAPVKTYDRSTRRTCQDIAEVNPTHRSRPLAGQPNASIKTYKRSTQGIDQDIQEVNPMYSSRPATNQTNVSTRPTQSPRTMTSRHIASVGKRVEPCQPRATYPSRPTASQTNPFIGNTINQTNAFIDTRAKSSRRIHREIS